MSITFDYPRCYVTGNAIALPYTCAPGKGLTYAKIHAEGQTLPITGWKGQFPLTTAPGTSDGVYEFEEGIIYGEVPREPDEPSFIDRVADGINRFFDTSDKATGAATVGGYAAIALIGAGLLFWYVPRKKR